MKIFIKIIKSIKKLKYKRNRTILINKLILIVKKGLIQGWKKLLSYLMLIVLGYFLSFLQLHFINGIDFTNSLTKQSLYQQINKDKNDNYNILDILSVDFYGDSIPSQVVLLNTKNYQLSNQPINIYIYEKNQSSYILVDKFAPTSKSLHYEYPTLNYVNYDIFNKEGKQSLILFFDLTGADHWGTTPIILSRFDGKYNYVSGFPEEIEDKERFDNEYKTIKIDIYDKYNESRKLSNYVVESYIFENEKDFIIVLYRATIDCRACDNPGRIDFYKFFGSEVKYDFEKEQGYIYISPFNNIEEFL